MRKVVTPLLLSALLVAAGCDTSGPAVDSQIDTVPSPSENASGQIENTVPETEGESYEFDFTLPSIEGETVSKADFAGKVLVVDIWGTWCPPCRKEVPHFVELQEELGDQGLQIVGINYEGTDTPAEAIEAIEQFKETIPVNYPLLLGSEEVRAQVPDFQGYPTTLFIDRTGKVRTTLVGLRPKAELKAIIESLMNESA
jgi:thiol-disulfide isomerase/thioredoxin